MSDQRTGRWDHLRYCAAVEVEIARFNKIIDELDPAVPVPSCPDWTVADLVRHLGSTHRWVEHLVRHRAQQRVRPREVEIDQPNDEADRPAWLAAGANRLVASLRATDSDTPVWTWGADQHVRFWSRRMLHETVIHRADAELALGRDVYVDPSTAVDGIEEFLTNLPYVRRGAEGVPELDRPGQTLHLHSTDTDGEWMITLQEKGFSWERGHHKGTVAVRATASDLLLLTYRRLRPGDGRCTVFGDHTLLASWLERTAF